MATRKCCEESFLRDQDHESDETNPEFEALLIYLKEERGCDFTGYKRSSLMRRFAHRMQTINIAAYDFYLAYLQRHTEECEALLDDIFINFTSFFRDRDTWDYLAQEIIPRIIANKPSSEPIRVWSAGCAAGQEIYSVLILLAEALGIEACLQRVQCFATDADKSALLQARQATYSSKDLIGMPPEWIEKYFKQTDKGYVFHAGLRRVVVFSSHNLTQDLPFTKIDLLTCRNVLIYFNPDTQASLLSCFHFALRNTGFLLLGKSELLMPGKEIFTPINAKQRVYAKASKLGINDHLAITSRSKKAQASQSSDPQNDFWKLAFESSSTAQLAINVNGRLLCANEQARNLFGLTLDDCKRPFRALEPAKLISFATLAKALYSKLPLTPLKDVEWTTEQGTKYFDIHVSRVLSPKNRLLGVTLTFVKSDNCSGIATELKSTRSELARVSSTLEATEFHLNMAYTELSNARQELEALHQEKQLGRETVEDRDRSPDSF